MNYWIEKTYPSRREIGDFTSLLLSPLTAVGGANIYANMKRVSIGDIVFHLDQDTNNVVGYSEAADSYNIISAGNEEWLSVDLELFQKLPKPIFIDEFLSRKENINTLREVKKDSEAFYQEKDNKFSLRQGGYLTKLDERIVKLFTVKTIVTKEVVAPIDEEEEHFEEGKVKYRVHKHKERSKKLIKLAKQRFKENNNGKLFCEACGFDFVKVYGKDIGEGFIEAHHTVPISSVSEDHKTKVSDLALLCSNCHRMVHRKRPWLTMGKLQSLIIKP